MRSSFMAAVLALAAVLAGALGTAAPAHAAPRTSVQPLTTSSVLGIDVSSHQGDVDWVAQQRRGIRFAYIKATEGSTYRNPYYLSQYGGAAQAGLLRGAYHFANPAGAGGAEQARYFVANGGRWVADGRTLPGVLDVEYNPSGAACYGLTAQQTVTWIRDFTTEYQRLTARAAIIYTNRDWWQRCTGDSAAFRTTNPLWVAAYASHPGVLPGSWTTYTFWQYSNFPIDQNRFNGNLSQLLALATGRARR